MVTIIIPVYKTEATLDQCVRSVLADADHAAQSTDGAGRPIVTEVILVDDGSPDHAPQMCDRWARDDRRVSVIHRTNGGLSAARNTGLDAAGGEYIMFVDSDDTIETGTIAAAVSAIESATDCDMAEFPVMRTGGCHHGETLSFADDTIGSTPGANGTRLYRSMRAYWLHAKAYAHSYTCNKIYRRHLFRDVRFPEGRVFEDSATLPLLLRHTRCVAVTPHGSYIYRDNPDGITSQAGSKEIASLLDANLHAWHLLQHDVPCPAGDRAAASADGKSSIPGSNPLCTATSSIDEADRAALDLYYMCIFNIQVTLCRLSAQRPTMPHHRVSPWSLPSRLALKALLLRIIGTDYTCRLLSHRLTWL